MKIDISSNGVWYHGSNVIFSQLREGSTITQWKELAEAFSHQPTCLGYNDSGEIEHNGTEKGYLYIIDEPVEVGVDIYQHPKTTMDENAEFLTRRPLKVKLIATVNEDDSLNSKSMKTLIINGSPRIYGDTESLIRVIRENIAGEYKELNAYRCNISPCIDCRYCHENRGCAIKDEMQEIYDYIQKCNNILIASPIYFSELTGKLLDVGSRLQTYFCARFFRQEEPILKPKKGAVILVGGGDGHMEKAYGTACTLLHHMNCYNIHEVVYSHHTNERPAIDDGRALMGIQSIIHFFNHEHC